jgi:hypothetical protein
LEEQESDGAGFLPNNASIVRKNVSLNILLLKHNERGALSALNTFRPTITNKLVAKFNNVINIDIAMTMEQQLRFNLDDVFIPGGVGIIYSSRGVSRVPVRLTQLNVAPFPSVVFVMVGLSAPP